MSGGKRRAIKRFAEVDDPFVDYVLEDVYIRRRVGEGAVRARVPQDAEDVIELYSMDEEALQRVLEALRRGDVQIRTYKLRRPTPEELEAWLIESQNELNSLPFFGYDEDEEW